jgi:hypothetical protein
MAIGIVASGPSEGANFMIAFRNRLQTTHHDADGAHRTGDQDRGAVLLAAVKNSETQEWSNGWRRATIETGLG